MTTIEILAATRARLLAKGWTPGSGRCLYMTLEAVVPDEVWYSQARPQVRAIEAIRTAVDTTSVATWNGQQTSIDLVLSALVAALTEEIARTAKAPVLR